MNANRKRAISNRAQSLLKDNEVTAPPVPVERIAKALDARAALFTTR